MSLTTYPFILASSSNQQQQQQQLGSNASKGQCQLSHTELEGRKIDNTNNNACPNG
jgi:hypothetical protein